MKKRIFSAILVLVMAFGVVNYFSPEALALSSSEIYKKAQKYTVEINVETRNFTATGSGFFITSDGNIVTNYHVIEGAVDIKVTDYNGKVYPCEKVIAYSKNYDLAVIDISGTNHSYAKINSTYDTGDTIYTLGSSKGLSYTFSDGLISNKSRTFDDYLENVSFIQISAPISNGNSGGPLINKNGEVIGINSMGYTGGQNLNFAIPYKYVGKLKKYNTAAIRYYADSYEMSDQDVFDGYAEYITDYGKYDNEYDDYYLGFKVGEGGGYEYDFIVIYDPYEEQIRLGYITTQKEDNSILCITTVYIDSDLNTFGTFVSYDYKAYFDIEKEDFDENYFNANFYSSNFPYNIINSGEKIASADTSVILNIFENECLREDTDYSLADAGFHYYGHKIYFNNLKEPSCKSSGYTGDQYCEVCGKKVKTGKTVSKLSHTYKTTLTKASLSADGKSVTKCSVCGTKEKETTIYYPKTIKLSKTAYTYTGKEIKPTVTVKDRKGKTISSSNYTVSYKNNKKVGKATVTVTFKGNYTGKKTLTFKINPKSTTIKNITGKSKAISVSWKKQATQTSGYQIQYSTSKKFTSSSTKTVTVSGSGKTAKTISKLKGSKTYYARIRTYKTVSNVKYYSPWSSAKSGKTKK